MIDWLDTTIDHLHDPLPTGRVAGISPDGEIEWQSPCRLEIRGSYDNRMWIRSQGGDGTGKATQLYISGNPVKFLQGHNVFGTEDINALLHETLRKASTYIDIPLDLAIAKSTTGNYSIKRLDVTRSFQFANRNEVAAVLAALAIKSRSRRGRAQTKGTTVYHGLGSRRWSFKFYGKADELEAGRKHALPDQLLDTPIKEFSENLLRAELQLRSKELDEIGIHTGSDVTPSVLNRVYRSYFGRLEMSAQATIPSKEIGLLKRCFRDTYLLWVQGIDPRPLMTKTTFFRHRAELIKYGIDVSIPKQSDADKIIPLFRQVTGSPVEVPEWAYSQDLIFDPNRIGG